MANDNTRCLYEWGKELLQEFPDGLKDEPDFERDGAARRIWFSKGYSIGVRWATEIGMGGEVYLGTTYDDPEALDEAGKAAFAKAAFDLGCLYLELARFEADKAAEQEASQRRAFDSIDRQVETLRNEIAAISSREALRIRIAEAKEEWVAARESGDPTEDYACSRRLNVLQDRLIEIEKHETRRGLSAWRVGLIGTAASIAGLIVGFLANSCGGS
jgi:hypothetical protein